MTPEQQRIAVAEWCGYKDLRHYPLGLHAKHDNPPANQEQTASHGYPVPDYANDLNAMHESEKKLSCEQKKTYCGWLAANEDSQIYAMTFATASQRLEALCRTIWPERF